MPKGGRDFSRKSQASGLAPGAGGLLCVQTRAEGLCFLVHKPELIYIPGSLLESLPSGRFTLQGMKGRDGINIAQGVASLLSGSKLLIPVSLWEPQTLYFT